MTFKVLIISLIYLLLEVQSAKILAVFSFPSFSHQVVFRTLTNELIRKGHEMTVITTDPAYVKEDTPSNLREIDVHNISYDAWRKLYMDNYKVEQNKDFTFTKIRQASLITSHIFEIQLQTAEIQELITNTSNKFDLLLIEAIIFEAFAYSHIFKAPVIMVTSLGAIFNSHDIIGSTIHPILYPSPLELKIYNLTFREKLKKMYAHYLFKFANSFNEADENVIIKKNLGKDVPPLDELYNNNRMFFINTYPIWADNQPVPQGVVYMGGIHQLPRKELPQDLKTYLDSSKHGVIYVSFGTNVLSGTVPDEIVQLMINVFQTLPYDILWKWDEDELNGKSSNIRISKWLPQSDLLRHPKIKLFVTQAGLQSTEEAVTAAVPLVSIPMLGDQWYNAEKYVKHGIGIQLDIKSLNKKEFKNAIETVVHNESYRRNIVKLRSIMLDQPQTPLQRTIWWLEYVLRHKGEHLRAPAANMSLIEYLEVELILLILCIVALALTLLIKTVNLIFNNISNFVHIKFKVKNK